jgi:hypothetical protein
VSILSAGSGPEPRLYHPRPVQAAGVPTVMMRAAGRFWRLAPPMMKSITKDKIIREEPWDREA